MFPMFVNLKLHKIRMQRNQKKSNIKVLIIIMINFCWKKKQKTLKLQNKVFEHNKINHFHCSIQFFKLKIKNFLSLSLFISSSWKKYIYVSGIFLKMFFCFYSDLSLIHSILTSVILVYVTYLFVTNTQIRTTAGIVLLL